MSVTEIETRPRLWDPTVAYKAHITERAERQRSAEIQHSLARMAHTTMVDTVVQIPDESGKKKQVSISEYVVWLDGKADAAHAEIEHFGGQAAVAAYTRIEAAIPYAGEVAPRPQPNPESDYPNYPA
jgi:hypothetical protein